MADLRTTLNGIEFPNPVLTAAGPNVIDARLMTAAAEGGAGGVVSKTFSVRPARDLRPTIRGLGSGGLVNAETWSEMTPEDFLAELAAAKKSLDARGLPLVVSVGYKPEEVASLVALADREIGPAGFEFSTHYTGGSLDPLVEVAKAARRATERPVWMKLSPGFPEIEELVKRSEPWVDAFVAVNSYGPVLDIDIETGRPRLGSTSGYGWMSGPPLLPIALRIVHLVSSVQKKPVVGVGGIERGEDAVKFLMAGASLVQVCSAAIKKGSGVYGAVARELGTWLDRHPEAGGPDGIRGLYARRLAERRAPQPDAVMTVREGVCTLCGACIGRCVQGALAKGNAAAVVDAGLCIGCGYCMDFCRSDAMELAGR